MGCGGEWRRLCTILDKRGKRKKISLNSEGQNWGERLNMEIRNLVQVSLLTVFSLQSDSLAPPFASLRLGARPSLLLGLSWPGLRYGTLPLLTALCSRKAVPPSGLRFHRSLPRIFPDAWLTALCSRKAVPPSGLRFHRSLPRSCQGAWLTALASRKAVPPRRGCLRQSTAPPPGGLVQVSGFHPPFPHPSPHGSLPWLPDLRSFTWKS